METIEVRYKYLGSFDGHPYYHKYLVYTTDTAVEAARGGPSVDGGTIQFSQAESHLAAHNPFGEIQVQTGTYDVEFIDFTVSPDPSEVLATGADLSSQWDDIVTAMNAIGNNSWAYLPVSQNSNSLADYAIAAAGLPAPSLDDRNNYWAPGSAHPFTVPYEPEELPVLPNPVPSVIQPAFADAISASSPLVIDLSSGHTGVTLTSWNASTTETFFDLNANGFAVQTAWVSGDTGLLARDLNSNGTIDSSAELFGSPTVDGFAKLAALDSNHDLRIDNNDGAWSSLVVWTDDNGDAVTQNGELHSLASLGIVNIDLAGVASSSSTISGNPISHTSTVTFTGGATATIADAWFVHDNTNSYYAGEYTLDVETLFLPTLRGYGTLPDLTVAMSQDSDLKDLVEDFVSSFTLASFADADALNYAVTNILYAWAGVADVDPDSRGANVDAQRLAFVEKLVGAEFFNVSDHTANPLQHAAWYIEQAYQKAFDMFTADLLVQLGATALFADAVSYNSATGTITSGVALSETAIGDLVGIAPAPGTYNLAFWEAVGRFIDNTRGFSNLTGDELGWLDDAVNGSDSSLHWTDVLNYIANDTPGSIINGTSGNDTLSGTSFQDTIAGGDGADTIHGNAGSDTISGNEGNDVIYGDVGGDTLLGGADDDILYGGDGNDTLYGGTGNNTLDGGAGGNFLHGDSGNDTYIYSGGNDVIDDAGGADAIYLGSGITLGDLSFTRVSSDGSVNNFWDLLIDIDGSGTIQLSYQLYPYSAHIETIVFADSSTLNLSTISNPDAHLTSGNDGFVYSGSEDLNAYGFDGNDIITFQSGGNHTIDGGAGNDSLNGGSGDDTYIASAGFDTISEANGGDDTIVIPAAFDIDDVTLYRINNAYGPTYDLGISIEGLGQIAISSQLYYYSAYAVEHLHFLSDNSTLDLTDLSITTVGTAGNDSLSPPVGNAGLNDILDGREGDDYLSGLAGDDTYVFSAGHDIINEASGEDTIRVRESYDPGDISIAFVQYNYADTALQLTDSDGNTILVSNHAYNSTYSVEHIAFGDSTIWDIDSMEIETHGTNGDDYYLTGHDIGDASSDDTIYGYDGNDFISGGNGDDLLYGGDGDDTIYAMTGSDIAHGDGDGDYLYGNDHATLYGDAGDDYLYNNGSNLDAATTVVTMYGGDGADTLVGGYGTNVMSGGNGADTMTGWSGCVDIFKFDAATAFDAVDTIQQLSTGDVIDISDILDGHYDPLTDVITDFVQFTTNGSNTDIYVDTTGSATFGSAQQIATIAYNTDSSLTDEAALVTAGTLLAA